MIPRSSSIPSLRRRSRHAPLVSFVNALLQALADGVLQPVVVLAAIAFLFGGSEYRIASFTTAAVVSWTLAPMLMTILRGATSRTDLIVLVASVIRLGAIVALAITALRIDDISTSTFLSWLVGTFIVYQAASAFGSQATTSVIAGAARGRNGSRMFRIRQVLAVLGTAVAALVGWRVLGSDNPFQHSVEQLLLLAALAVLAATWFLLQLPNGRSALPRTSVKSMVGQPFAAFRVAAYRRFSTYKVLLALSAAVDPFIIVFGFRELGLQVEYVGVALLALAAGHAAGALVWPRWIARSGPRVPFQLAALFRLALLLWIISLPGLVSSSLYTDRFDSTTAAMRGFAFGFALLGLAASVGTFANQRYLMNLTRPESLPGATMANNLLMAICGFGPLVVARLLTDYSLDRILWGAAVCAGLALFASGLLVESAIRVRRPVGTWKTSRQATSEA